MRSNILNVTWTKLAKIVIPLIALIAVFFWGALAIKNKIFPYQVIKVVFEDFDTDRVESDTYDKDKLWASKIQKGGYILHFRHAQREKWTDVTAFDAYELFNKIDAEHSSFADAVCLTPRGIEEAKLIGKVFIVKNIKVEKVVSSPSCRAVQTARYAFGKVDLIDNSLLHRTAIMKDQWPFFAKQLKELMLGLNPSFGANIVLSGHGGTLKYDGPNLFETDITGGIDNRDETGFIVIENLNGKLHARHKFNSIKNFVNASMALPLH